MSRISAGLQMLLLVAGAAATGAQAQGLVHTQKLSASLANELVGDTVAICAQKGYQVVAVVVDLDGVRQALLRGNGAPIHSMDNAYYKAYSAASLTLSRKEDSTKAARPDGQGRSDHRAADASAQRHLRSRRGGHHGGRCHDRRDRSERRPRRRTR